MPCPCRSEKSRGAGERQETRGPLPHSPAGAAPAGVVVHTAALPLLPADDHELKVLRLLDEVAHVVEVVEGGVAPPVGAAAARVPAQQAGHRGVEPRKGCGVLEAVDREAGGALRGKGGAEAGEEAG